MRSPVRAVEASGELARLGEIARVAIGKGLAHYAARLGYGAKDAAGEESGGQADARRLREALEELGPTFVKFGQMLSSRTDSCARRIRGRRRPGRRLGGDCAAFRKTLRQTA